MAIFTSLSALKTILLYGWPFLILIWLVVLKVMWKNWPVDVVIIEKRGENLIKTNDRAGKYKDPYTGMIGYRLKKSKDTFPVVNYDWVLHNTAVATTFFDRIINLLRGNIGTLFLFRYGSKQYKPINVKQNGETKLKLQEQRDKFGKPIWINCYQQFDPRLTLGSLDFEVVDWDNMNFMVQEQRASIIRRQKKSEMWKTALIPVAMLAVTALICIIAIKLSFDFAGDVKNTNIQASTPPPKDTNILDSIKPGE